MADLIDRGASIRFISNIERDDEDRLFTFAEIKKMLWDAPAVNRWIPCSERLPEQEVRILLFAAGEVYVGELTDIKDLYDTDIGFMKSGHVTHWMYLPEPPEKEYDDET